MIRYVYLDRASGFGSVYDFEHEGDLLPTHAHGPDEQHSVEVLRGSVELSTEGYEPVMLWAGHAMSFDSSKRHTIKALEPNTLTFHRYVNGKPSWYTPEILAGGVIS